MGLPLHQSNSLSRWESKRLRTVPSQDTFPQQRPSQSEVMCDLAPCGALRWLFQPQEDP